jgi:hypothetical protein
MRVQMKKVAVYAGMRKHDFTEVIWFSQETLFSALKKGRSASQRI